MSNLIINQSCLVRYVGLFFVFLLGQFSSLWAQTFQKDGLTYEVIPDAQAQVEIVECDSSLKHLFIPDSVTYCGKKYCVVLCGGYPDSLEYITVADNNPFMSSLDGVLFNKERTELLRYPRGLKNSSYVVPASVRKICTNAFCLASVKSVKLSPSVKEIDNLAFSLCFSLKSIVFGKKLRVIGRNAFTGCSALTSVEIPEGVDTIERAAFAECASLQFAQLPSTVSYMRHPFINCPSLKEVRVAKGNPFYSSEGGVLFNKDKTVLLKYPSNKADTVYRIPDTVKELEWNAFDEVKSLVRIAFPGSLHNINKDVFRACPSLTTLEIPKSLLHISREEFEECNSLNSVVFAEDVDTLDLYHFRLHPKSVTLPASLQCLHLYLYNEGYPIPGLGEVKVSPDNRIFMSEDGVLYNKDQTKVILYPSQKKDSVYIVPHKVKNIQRALFVDSNIKTLVLPDSLESIDYLSFSGCFSLDTIVINHEFRLMYLSYRTPPITFFSYGARSVRIGKNVNIDEIAGYLACDAHEFVVSEENPEYSSEDGVVFNKDKTRLILYPAGRKDSVYVVPSTVKEIAPNAFNKPDSLTSLILPDGLKTIDQNLLYECSFIKKLRLPPYVEITNIWRQPYIIR